MKSLEDRSLRELIDGQRTNLVLDVKTVKMRDSTDTPLSQKDTTDTTCKCNKIIQLLPEMKASRYEYLT